MLGHAVGRDDVRKSWIVPGLMVWIVLAIPLHSRRIALLEIEWVLQHRFFRLVVSRQRTILQTGGREQPALPVRLHDEWIDARNSILATRVLRGTVGGWAI